MCMRKTYMQSHYGEHHSGNGAKLSYGLRYDDLAWRHNKLKNLYDQLYDKYTELGGT